jgi:hypothetical protein
MPASARLPAPIRTESENKIELNTESLCVFFIRKICRNIGVKKSEIKAPELGLVEHMMKTNTGLINRDKTPIILYLVRWGSM